MKWLYRLLKKNPDSREDILSMTSGLGIVANFGISLFKIIIGAITSSIAILTEGVNNATDALTSILTFVGTKLAKKHPDADHPFGYGRIEYLTSLVVATVILVTGTEMAITAVKGILHPAVLTVSYWSVIFVLITAVVKFVLGLYTIRMGKKADSRLLVGLGEDCRNDSFSSAITIVASLIFLLFDFSIDAYAGILMALLIIKTGVELLLETIRDLLGRSGDKDLATKLYKEITSTEGVVGAADMMLHNYGPDAWSGSCNLEIDHSMTVGEVYEFVHDLQLRIMHEYQVTMVFGIYAVAYDHEEMKALGRTIHEFMETNPHIKSYHAIYVDEKTKTIYCDYIVDYELQDWDGVREQFKAFMADKYPEMNIQLTIETEFV